jgi:hypothetical protein
METCSGDAFVRAVPYRCVGVCSGRGCAESGGCRLLTVQRAARLLGVDTDTVETWSACNGLPRFKRRYYELRSIVEWVKRRESRRPHLRPITIELPGLQAPPRQLPLAELLHSMRGAQIERTDVPREERYGRSVEDPFLLWWQKPRHRGRKNVAHWWRWCH